MSQDPKQKSGEDRRGRLAVGADCKGHDYCAGGGWRGEHDFLVNEVEVHGTGQRPQMQEAGAQNPDGPRTTWLPSCVGGSRGPGGHAGTGRCVCNLVQHCT